MQGFRVAGCQKRGNYSQPLTLPSISHTSDILHQIALEKSQDPPRATPDDHLPGERKDGEFQVILMFAGWRVWGEEKGFAYFEAPPLPEKDRETAHYQC